MYLMACDILNLTPSQRYMNGVNCGRVIAGYQGFGPLGAEAVAFSLSVSISNVIYLWLSGFIFDLGSASLLGFPGRVS